MGKVPSYVDVNVSGIYRVEYFLLDREASLDARPRLPGQAGGSSCIAMVMVTSHINKLLVVILSPNV